MAPVPISPINVGHIDDVQELRKSGPATIPERFVRDMTERPALDTAPPSPNTVPVIDFSRLVKGNKEEHKSEMLVLTRACEEWGFFQVINHGIDQSMLKSIEKVAKDFFMLPLDEKQKHQMLPGTVQGYGQAFVFSEDQKLDWCNMFALGLEPHFIRVPENSSCNFCFSETVEIYSGEVRKLCQHLLQYIAMTLNLRADFFEEMFGVAVQAIRMNYYPPCARPDLVLGLSPHSDGSALTVLQQGKGSPGGLQILKDSKWIPVQPAREKQLSMMTFDNPRWTTKRASSLHSPTCNHHFLLLESSRLPSFKTLFFFFRSGGFLRRVISAKWGPKCMSKSTG